MFQYIMKKDTAMKKQIRKCRFCDQQLDEEHRFFCSEFCRDLFEEEYNIVLTQEQRALRCRELYKAV